MCVIIYDEQSMTKLPLIRGRRGSFHIHFRNPFHFRGNGRLSRDGASPPFPSSPPLLPPRHFFESLEAADGEKV